MAFYCYYYNFGHRAPFTPTCSSSEHLPGSTWGVRRGWRVCGDAGNVYDPSLAPSRFPSTRDSAHRRCQKRDYICSRGSRRGAQTPRERKQKSDRFPPDNPQPAHDGRRTPLRNPRPRHRSRHQGQAGEKGEGRFTFDSQRWIRALAEVLTPEPPCLFSPRRCS